MYSGRRFYRRAPGVISQTQQKTLFVGPLQCRLLEDDEGRRLYSVPLPTDLAFADSELRLRVSARVCLRLIWLFL